MCIKLNKSEITFQYKILKEILLLLYLSKPECYWIEWSFVRFCRHLKYYCIIQLSLCLSVSLSVSLSLSLTTKILGDVITRSSFWWKNNNYSRGYTRWGPHILNGFHQLISEPTNLLPTSSFVDLVFTD